jgi:hypothetical protein
MNEVRVYDGSGNLKEVISVAALSIRSEKQIEAPYLFMKNKKKPGRPSAASSENQEKTEVS